MVVKRFDVYLINLSPTIGSEIQKTRPCLLWSNRHNKLQHLGTLNRKSAIQRQYWASFGESQALPAMYDGVY